MRIHKEGHTILLVLFFVLLTLDLSLFFLIKPVDAALWGLVGFSLIIFLLILQFFRSPNVKTPLNELDVIAPACGKVVVIERVEEKEYFNEERIQFSIFMSPVNVHVNRSPIDGIVRYFKYHPGKYLVAWHPKSSTENERTTLVIENKKGVQVLVRQIAGMMARRIRWYVEEGSKLKQGQEFGFIKFGSRVDVLLPVGVNIKVSLGEKVVAGKTVIASFS